MNNTHMNNKNTTDSKKTKVKSGYPQGRHPNSLKALRKPQDRTPEERKRIAAKGGRASKGITKTFSLETQLKRMIEKKEISENEAQNIYDFITSHEAATLQLVKAVRDMAVEDPKKKNTALRMLMELAKFKHGEKVKRENVNINVEMKESDYISMIYKDTFKEEKKVEEDTNEEN